MKDCGGGALGREEVTPARERMWYGAGENTAGRRPGCIGHIEDTFLSLTSLGQSLIKVG